MAFLSKLFCCGRARHQVQSDLVPANDPTVTQGLSASIVVFLNCFQRSLDPDNDDIDLPARFITNENIQTSKRSTVPKSILVKSSHGFSTSIPTNYEQEHQAGKEGVTADETKAEDEQEPQAGGEDASIDEAKTEEPHVATCNKGKPSKKYITGFREVQGMDIIRTASWLY